MSVFREHVDIRQKWLTNCGQENLEKREDNGAEGALVSKKATDID